MRRWPALLGLAALVAVLGPAIHEDQHRSPVEIRRFELDVAPTALVAVGDVLLSNGWAGDRPSEDPRVWQALLRSTDLGQSWESLTLPGAPPGVSYVLVGPGEVGGDVAVVVGEVDIDPADSPLSGRVGYLWASADGMTWSGGSFAGVSPPTGWRILVRAVDGVLFAAFDNRLHRSTDLGASWTEATVPDLPLAAGETAAVRDIWRDSPGRVVASLTDAASGPPMLATGAAAVLVSDDDGVTWRLDACPFEVPSGGPCLRNQRTVGSLQLRRTPGGEQVSIDGGATWHEPDLPVAADLVDELHLRPVVPRDAGGWLAVATIDPPGDFQEDLLLASDDGLGWRDLSPSSPCASDEIQEDPEFILPAVSFSPPLRFDGHWLVIHTCAGVNTLVESELLLVDASATEATPVPGTRLDAAEYGSAVNVGDAVVMLESHDDAGDRALLQVWPSSTP